MSDRMASRATIWTTVLMAGVLLSWHRTFRLWVDLIIRQGTYRITFGWFDLASAILWALTLALFLVFGLALTRLTLQSQRVLPAATFGAACGIILLSSSRNYFTDAATDRRSNGQSACEANQVPKTGVAGVREI